MILDLIITDGTLDPLALLALLGSAQGLLLVLAIGSARRSAAEPARRTLLALILAATCAGASIALAHSGLVRSVILLTIFEYAVTLVTGPLLLLFVRSTTGSVRRTFRLHFIPAATWTLYVTVQTIEIQWRGETALPLFLPPIGWLLLHQVAYTVASARACLRATDRRRVIVGPGTLVAGFVALHVVQWIRFAFRHLHALENVVPLALSVGFVVLTLVLLRQAIVGTVKAMPQPKYAGSSLLPARAEEIERSLLSALGADRTFRDSRLTVARMAAKLHVPQTHLSQVINQRLGRSFAELVADYRIREARRLLADPAATDRTIEAIGREAGFLSRSSFYEAFKRQTGETPSAFRCRKRPRS